MRKHANTTNDYRTIQQKLLEPALHSVAEDVGCEQQTRYRLGLLTGGVVLGGLYILHQALDIYVAPPFMTVIRLVALLMTGTVAYPALVRGSTPTSE